MWTSLQLWSSFPFMIKQDKTVSKERKAWRWSLQTCFLYLTSWVTTLMHFHGYCFSCLVSCLPVLSRQEECFEETNAVQLNLQNCIFELYLLIVSTFMLKDKHAERTGAHFCVNCLLQNLNEVWGFECAYMYIALCHLSYHVYKTCWSGSRKSGVLPSFLLFWLLLLVDEDDDDDNNNDKEMQDEIGWEINFSRSIWTLCWESLSWKDLMLLLP